MTQSKPTILVIDDSEAVLARVKERLESAGFTVITSAQTVGMARHLATASIVIIDFHMPGLSGKEVLASLRASAESLSRKVVFYLYTSDEEIARTAKLLGFDGAFRFKGNLDELVRQIDVAARMLALQGLER